MRIISCLFLSFISCAHRPEPVPSSKPSAPVVKENISRKIGILFERIEEGVVVNKVLNGMGADLAGIKVGDLVTSVNGGPVFDGDENRILQGKEKEIELLVQSPFEEPRTLIVKRGLRRKKVRTGGRSADFILLRKKISTGSSEEVLKTLASFDKPNSDEMALSLRLISKSRRRMLPEVLPGYSNLAIEKAEYWSLLTHMWAKQGNWSEALSTYEKFNRRRTADHFAPDKTIFDLGGDHKVRRVGIEAAWYAGAKNKSLSALEHLEETQDTQKIRTKLKLPNPQDGELWRAQLPPVSDFSLKLLDGTDWKLSDHLGKPVILNFWASWCGPCKKELPELQRYADQIKDGSVSFLAVSTDSESDRDKVEAKVNSLGLRIPVAHSPSLGAQFSISSIPSVRLLDGNGAPQYFARGYSKKSIPTLKKQVAILQGGEGAGAPLGEIFGSDSAAPLKFIPQPQLRGLQSTAEGLLIGMEEGSPLLVDKVGDGLEVDLNTQKLYRTGDLLSWLGGPISAAEGGFVLRSFDPYDELRWMRNLPHPVVDLLVSGDRIFVATLSVYRHVVCLERKLFQDHASF